MAEPLSPEVLAEIKKKLEGGELAPQRPDDEAPFFKPGWYKSRKFWSAVVLSGLCFGAAGFTGTLNGTTAPFCAGPLLAWVGIEGAVDFAKAWKK